MKKILIFITIVVAVVVIVIGVIWTIITSNGFIISEIDKKVQETDIYLRNYQTTEKTIPDSKTTEGARAIYYLDGKDLKKIEATYYSEMGQYKYAYYYDKNSQLSFVLLRNEQYNAPFYYNRQRAEEEGITTGYFDPEKSIITEEKYYFYDDKLIEWLDGSKKEVIDRDVLKEKESEIIKDNQELKDLLFL